MKKKIAKKKRSKNVSLWSKVKNSWDNLVEHARDHVLCLNGLNHLIHGLLGAGLVVGCLSLEVALGLGLVWYSLKGILHIK